MSEIKSIWDGWERKCEWLLADTEGRQCARGFVMKYRRGCNDRQRARSFNRELAHVDTYMRVAARIASMFGWEQPQTFIAAQCLIADANNKMGLTPDDFRRIDRETQIEAAVRPLVESIEAAQPQEVEHEHA